MQSTLAIRRHWGRRVALALVAPLFLLLLVEGLLRLFGYGYPTAFFVPAAAGTVTSNEKFGWQFFPPAIARAPLPLTLNTPKPAGTYRIFILGESAALGDPEPAFGFGRILEVMLMQQLPGRRVEVINASMSAINSHAIRLIAKDCARYEPDAFIIYMGNNEVVGPYGPGSVFQNGDTPLPFIRAGLWLRGTRLGQLLRALTGSIGQEKTPRFWKSLEMFSAHRIRHDDPGMARVYANFEANLRDILETTTAVPTFLCTVAVNLRDSPPFASLHRSELTATESNQWSAAFQRGITAQHEGRTADGLTALSEAAAVDADHAELQYRLAELHHAQTNLAGARTGFLLARDMDALHFRADSTLNDIIRVMAPSNAARLIDIAASFENPEVSPSGFPGSESFYEHVHFTFYGNHTVAKALFTAIQPLLFSALQTAPDTGAATPEAGPPPSQAACTELLALTPWDQFRIVEAMAGRMEAPPFTFQSGHSNRMAGIRSLLRSARGEIMSGLDSARDTYQVAVKASPDDWQLRENFAKLHEARRDLPAAIEQWRHVIRLKPGYPRGWEGLGVSCMGLGQHEEGVAALMEARRLSPHDPFALLNLGSALHMAGDKKRGMTLYREAVALCPDNSGIHYTVGTACMNDGDGVAARQHFETALSLDPDNAEAHNNLAILLFKQGDREAAVRHWREALRVRPDFQEALRNLMGAGPAAGK